MMRDGDRLVITTGNRVETKIWSVRLGGWVEPGAPPEEIERRAAEHDRHWAAVSASRAERRLQA